MRAMFLSPSGIHKENIMGREVKRLALDFDWPINETWEGYCMPEDIWAGKCGSCDGSGYNRETKFISDSWYTHKHPHGGEGWSAHLEQIEVDELVKRGRLHDFTRVWITNESPTKPMTKETILDLLDIEEEHFITRVENDHIKEADDGLYIIVSGWMPRSDGYHPTAEEVNEWSRKGLGHDSINHWICTEARAKAKGVWGTCPICEGTGELWRNDAHKAAYETWESTEPPAGEGWQLWETVSEGSPQSPVFETKEELSFWMQENGDGNSAGYSKESADAFVNAGWAPSMMLIDGDFMTGVDAMGVIHGKDEK